MKGMEKMKKSHIWLIRIGFMLICSSYIYSRAVQKTDYTFPGINVGMIVLILLLAAIGGFCLIGYIAKRQWPLEKVFLFFGAYVCILYFASLPVFRAPDEINHYMRAFEISEGNLISQHMGDTGVGGNYLPQELIPTELCDARQIDYYKVWANKDVEMSEDQRIEYTYGNTALYAPVAYLPQALGIAIGKFFTQKSVYLVYWGRTFSFLVCFGLLYFSIKNMINKKMMVFLSCFMPMLMSQIVSLSADALTLSVAFALWSYVLKVSLDENIKKINLKSKIWIFSLTIVLSLCKIVYLPLCLVILLLDGEKFKTRRESLVYKLGSILSVAILNLFWLSISSGFLVEFNVGVNSAEQVKYVLTHPISYMNSCLYTLLMKGQGWMEEMVGSKLGWAMDVQTPRLIIVMMLALFIFSAFVNDKNEQCRLVDVRKKYFAGVCLLITVALIFTSLYVQWTPVAEFVIDGIQGRYFIPLIPAAAVLFMGNNRSRQYSGEHIYQMIFLVNMIAVTEQVFFYL